MVSVHERKERDDGRAVSCRHRFLENTTRWHKTNGRLMFGLKAGWRSRGRGGDCPTELGSRFARMENGTMPQATATARRSAGVGVSLAAPAEHLE